MWGNRTTIAPDSRVTGAPAADGDVSDDEQIGLIPVAAQGGSVVSLGAGTPGDDWRARDGATLERVSRETGGAVENDSATLRVDGNDDLTPTVVTEQPILDTDLVRHDSLTATVMPGSLADTDSPVQFRFRLVHDASQRGRPTREGASRPSDRGPHDSRAQAGPRGEGSVTSATFRAPQRQPIRLFWDLSELDSAVLENARRLEIVCERADRPADEGPYGAGASGVRGPVFVEDVVLTDSPDAITAARLQTQWQRLEAIHGPHESTSTDHKTGSTESGAFVFADGTATPYDFEIRADGTHVFTLGESAYRFEDGMAAVESL